MESLLQRIARLESKFSKQTPTHPSKIAPSSPKPAGKGSGERVQVTLTNRKAIFRQPYTTELVKSYFSFQPDGYRFSPKFQMGVWDGTISLFKHGAVGTGLFLEKLHMIQKEGKLKLDVLDKREPCRFHKLHLEQFTDRQYQKDCVEAMIAASNTGGLVIMGTGVGKTRTCGILFKHLIGSACFVVDELTLLDQARKEFQEVLQEEVGIIGNQQFQPQRITVATVQTLHRHVTDPKFVRWHKTLEAIVVDEVHVQLNKRNFDTVRSIQPKAVYGLTATLQLEKPEVSMQAVSFAGPKIMDYPLADGTKDGVLKPGIVVCCDLVRNTAQAKTLEESQALYMKYIVGSKKRNDMVEALVREAIQRGLRTILVVERILHLKILHERLLDAPHTLVYGAIDPQERKQAVKDFDSGKISLLIVNKVFKKGINIRNVGCIIDAAAQSSENDASQKFGRGVRLGVHEGLIYIDIGDVKDRLEAGIEEPFNFAEGGCKTRRKAFKKTGVPVERIIYRSNPEVVFQLGEDMLNAVLDGNKI